MRSLPFALAATALLAACAGAPDRSDHGQPPEGGPASLSVVNSPNGEILGRAVCADALAAWFVRTDANHDGKVSKDEFMADSRAQFARMDTDGDSFVTPAEIQAMRHPFQLARNAERPDRRDGPGGNGPGGGQEGGDPGSGRRGGSERALDSVMAADTNLDFRVTAAEFEQRGEEEFARLDRDGDHRLSLEEVTGSCPRRDGDGAP